MTAPWIRSPFLLLPWLLFATACAPAGEADREPDPGDEAPSDSTAVSGYTNLSVEELRVMMAGDDLVLVNVHIPFEGDIPGTDLSIPFNEIAQHTDQLPEDRGVRIVLYCRSGRMSEEAAGTLASLGYTNLFNLAGGFRAWEAAGHEIVR